MERQEIRSTIALMDELERKQKQDPDRFQLASAMLSLKNEKFEPPLTNGELYILASRVHEMQYHSDCCYLYEERLDAVRVLLEFGTKAPRAIDSIPVMAADEMCSFLLTCDLDRFALLVDCVANENQLFYGEDNFNLKSPEYAEELDALRLAMKIALEKKSPLSEQIQNAQQRTGSQSLDFTAMKGPER